MSRRTRVLLGITLILMLAAAGFIIRYDPSRAQYNLFQEHRGTFDTVKTETLLLMDGLDKGRNIGNTFIYSNNGNAAAPMFFEGTNAGLQDKIRQLAALSKDTLNFVRYSRQDGKDLLRFVFDWEGEHGPTYHIVYGASQHMVEQAYAAEPVPYKLSALTEGWYGIEIK
ncbi:hypothetical protein NST04_04630 [Paenibacillus sp. FSL H7-0756]|uniref:hypothetical protein n=1 Tax=unclassified Paenibacillus TaxID=185978 RepID=UPI0030F525CC